MTNCKNCGHPMGHHMHLIGNDFDNCIATKECRCRKFEP